MSLLFTPTTGILGGTLIGASTSLLLWMNGDILGLSGIMSSVGLHPLETTRTVASHWKLAFLASFALSASFWESNMVGPNDNYAGLPTRNFLAHLVGGLLVGIGTKLGNGCTTGHGICGIARYSLRSLVAVLTFTITGIATAVATSHVGPWSDTTRFLRLDDGVTDSASKPLGSAVVAIIVFLGLIRQMDANHKDTVDDIKIYLRKTIGGTLSGAMIAVGLAVSGMSKVHKVLGFLDFSQLLIDGGKYYDPTLVTVLVSAIFAGWVGYKFVDGHHAVPDNTCLKTPVCAPTWSIPKTSVIDSKLLLGATMFGLGWGIAGFCPGPALYQAVNGNVPVVLGWVPTFLVGSYIGQIVKDQMDQPQPIKKL